LGASARGPGRRPEGTDRGLRRGGGRDNNQRANLDGDRRMDREPAGAVEARGTVRREVGLGGRLFASGGSARGLLA
jgi:hypothetical protein